MTRARAAIVAWLVLVASCDRAPSRAPHEAAPPPQRPTASAPPTPIDAAPAPVVDAAPAIDAAPATLEAGKWWKGYGTTCIEVFGDQTVEIAIHGQTRNRARAYGAYTATQLGDGKVRVHIAKVKLVSKQLTSCRKSWADQPIKHLTVLGRIVNNGDSLTFTLEVLDGGAKVELCVATCVTLDRTEPSGHRSAGVRSKADEW